MKLPFCLLVGASLFLAGCGEKSTPPAQTTNASTPSASSPLTAPVDYLGAVVDAQQKAVKTVDTVSLNQAIHMFQIDKGRNPKDLNELVQGKFISQIPAAPVGSKIVYDANVGEVKVVKQ